MPETNEAETADLKARIAQSEDKIRQIMATEIGTGTPGDIVASKNAQQKAIAKHQRWIAEWTAKLPKS